LFSIKQLSSPHCNAAVVAAVAAAAADVGVGVAVVVAVVVAAFGGKIWGRNNHQNFSNFPRWKIFARKILNVSLEKGRFESFEKQEHISYLAS